MKRWLFSLLVLISLCLSSAAQAREYGTYVFINTCDDLEEFLLQTDITEDEYELLAALCERPMNINGADRDMLYDLPGMTYGVAQEIITYRAENGAYPRISVLRQVPGVTDALLAQIKPFIQVQYGGDIYSDAAGAASQVEDEEPLQLKVKVGSILRKGTGRAKDQVNLAAEPPSTPSFMLDSHGTAFSNLGFGVAAIVTRLTDVSWDNSRGALMGAPAAAFDLHSAFVSVRENSWSGILGSYDVGFGEKLVFDTTRTRHPHGWRHAKGLYRNNESGLYRSSAPLFGTALSLEQADFEYGWLDATVFASYQTENLYQYQMRHGLDDLYLSEEGGENTCTSGTDCPEGYTCGEDNMCYSSRIYDPETGTSYQYQTIANAFRELVTGANITWSLNESTSVSVTGYRGETQFVVAAPANPEFSGTTTNPRRSVYGAVGVSARWGNDYLDTGLSYAYSDNGGHAGLVRAVWEPAKAAEFTLTGRYYTHLYDNPYARSYAAATTTFGNRRRNERGVRLESVLEPTKWLRLVTSADVYNKIKLDVYDDAGVLQWLDNAVWDMRLRQSAIFDLSKKERLNLTYSYSDNDISQGGHDEVYSGEERYELGSASYDEFQGNLYITGKGARHSWSTGLTTERLRGYRFSLHYRGAAQDVSTFDDKMMLTHSLRGTVSAKPISGALVRLSVSHALEQVAVRYPSLIEAIPDGYTLGTPDGTTSAYVDWRQNISDWLSVRARYSLISYGNTVQPVYEVGADGEVGLAEPAADAGERSGRYNTYHIGSVEMTFTY